MNSFLNIKLSIALNGNHPIQWSELKIARKKGHLSANFSLLAKNNKPLNPTEPTNGASFLFLSLENWLRNLWYLRVSSVLNAPRKMIDVNYMFRMPPEIMLNFLSSFILKTDSSNNALLFKKSIRRLFINVESLLIDLIKANYNESNFQWKTKMRKNANFMEATTDMLNFASTSSPETGASIIKGHLTKRCSRLRSLEQGIGGTVACG